MATTGETSVAARPRRLGWLGPAIVTLGAAVAGVGVWYMVSSKPKPGDVIDTIKIDATSSIVVRAERGGDRAFVELHQGDEVAWQALVPPYAGRPGKPAVAWGEVAISVRVIRDGKAEVFALSRNDASKLGGIHLAGEHGAIKLDAPGPITLTDHIRSYELVTGDGWTQMTGIDLMTGKRLWSTELGPEPVTAGEVNGGLIKLEQGGQKHYYRVFTGREDRSSEATGIPLVPPGAKPLDDSAPGPAGGLPPVPGDL